MLQTNVASDDRELQSDVEDSPQSESWVMVGIGSQADDEHLPTPIDSLHSPSFAARAAAAGHQRDDADSPSQSQSELWVMVGSGSQADDDHPPTPIDSLHSLSFLTHAAAAGHQLSSSPPEPSCSHPSRTLTIPPAPRNAPPALPASPSEPCCSYPSRTLPTQTATWQRLTKGTKDMDNVNLRSSYLNPHPLNLQPGNRRRPPPLPVSRSGRIGDAVDRVLILVTADSVRYVNVDITNAPNPAFIRARVFTKLNIYDEEGQSHFSIYRTEIGSSAIGDALPDDKLFELCRELGDNKGSLKFLVSRSSARVLSAGTPTTTMGAPRSYARPNRPLPIPPPTITMPVRFSRPSDIHHSDPLQSPSGPRSPTLFTRDRRSRSSLSSVGNYPPEITTSTTPNDLPKSGDVQWATLVFSDADSTRLLPESITSYSSDSDDSDADTWKKPPSAERPKSILRPALTVQIPRSRQTFAGTQALRPGFPSPSLVSGAKASRDKESARINILPVQQGWVPRPPPEDIYERLEDFFPEHDLDKPVKSIRYIAQERKRYVDRTSRGGGDSSTVIQRKQTTKLWRSRVEEVDTANLPESPLASAEELTTTFKWVRGELIHRGTYGRVYLALNATTGEMFAVKQIEIPHNASDKNDTRQTSVVQALKMESETLKVLDHPNIVQYLGFEETPTNLNIFLEYVPGGSIGSCLRKYGKFEEDITKSFTSQILAGLEYLHSKGILHRDLRSDKILIEMTGVCKISDFGMSKRTGDHDEAHAMMRGTVFWMAPELINTQKKGYNFKIDIWSIGCVVLEMWTGTPPWTGDEMLAVIFKLFQSKLPPPIPKDLVLTASANDFRRKCFAINPDERPTAAELCQHPYLTPTPGWVFNGFAHKSQDM